MPAPLEGSLAELCKAKLKQGAQEQVGGRFNPRA
jgi:hypothetical protein